jgi:hypothetical protein
MASATALAMAALFAAAITGCPHFGQDEMSEGNLVPHLLHADRAGIVATEVLSGAAPAFWPHFKQNCEPSGSFVPHQLQNTWASLSLRFRVWSPLRDNWTNILVFL